MDHAAIAAFLVGLDLQAQRWRLKVFVLLGDAEVDDALLLGDESAVRCIRGRQTPLDPLHDFVRFEPQVQFETGAKTGLTQRGGEMARVAGRPESSWRT